jgi:hypothetical protein
MDELFAHDPAEHIEVNTELAEISWEAQTPQSVGPVTLCASS